MALFFKPYGRLPCPCCGTSQPDAETTGSAE
jgi:hypothetical protein